MAVLEGMLVTPPHYYVGMVHQRLAHKVSIERKCANRDCAPSKIDYQSDSPIPVAMPPLTETLLDADRATLLREPDAVAWGCLEVLQLVAETQPEPVSPMPSEFAFNRMVTGDARTTLAGLPADSVSLSFWSPPYYVGKSYERHLSFEDWQELIREVIHCHTRIIQPRCFMHEAEFSEELAERVIRLFPLVGSVVLDLFVGTGTTTCAAKRLSRQWFGIDTNPARTDIAIQQTNKVKLHRTFTTSKPSITILGKNIIFQAKQNLDVLYCILTQV